MGLPNLLDAPPGERGFNEWIFSHALDHQQIVQAFQKLGYPMTIYPLDPFLIEAQRDWAEIHQQAHRDFDQILNTEAVDMTGVDFTQAPSREAFYWANYNEHLNVRTVLKI